MCLVSLGKMYTISIPESVLKSIFRGQRVKQNWTIIFGFYQYKHVFCLLNYNLVLKKVTLVQYIYTQPVDSVFCVLR